MQGPPGPGGLPGELGRVGILVSKVLTVFKWFRFPNSVVKSVKPHFQIRAGTGSSADPCLIKSEQILSLFSITLQLTQYVDLSPRGKIHF